MKVVVNHLGFRPQDRKKQAIIWGEREFTEFQNVNLAENGYYAIDPGSPPNSIIYRSKLSSKVTNGELIIFI